MILHARLFLLILVAHLLMSDKSMVIFAESPSNEPLPFLNADFFADSLSDASPHRCAPPGGTGVSAIPA